MPAEGVQLSERSKLLTNEEIFQIARLFVEQGVRKIRLTGGEPTVRKDIVHIIGKCDLIYCPKRKYHTYIYSGYSVSQCWMFSQFFFVPSLQKL